MLLEQLSLHKLDMILSDCRWIQRSRKDVSVKLGESPISFYAAIPLRVSIFLLVWSSVPADPRRRSMLGRKLLNGLIRGIEVNILGEFDDAALMKAFGMNNDAIFVAPAIYSSTEFQDEKIVEVGPWRGFWKSTT